LLPLLREPGLPFDDLAKRLRAAVARLAASVDREQRSADAALSIERVSGTVSPNA
jgi:hypothetical protein